MAWSIAWRALLVAATFVCLASMGGAMVVAFPVLIPLHWWAARGAGPAATGAWAALAGASALQAAWMLAFMASGHTVTSAVVGVLAGLATATAMAWLRSGSRAHATGGTEPTTA